MRGWVIAAVVAVGLLALLVLGLGTMVRGRPIPNRAKLAIVAAVVWLLSPIDVLPDVALPVVKRFTEAVKAKAVGTEVQGSPTPGQALVGVIHDELVQLMGGNARPFDLRYAPPAVILLVAAAMSGFAAFRAVAPGVTGGEFSDSDVERAVSRAAAVRRYLIRGQREGDHPAVRRHVADQILRAGKAAHRRAATGLTGRNVTLADVFPLHHGVDQVMRARPHPDLRVVVPALGVDRLTGPDHLLPPAGLVLGAVARGVGARGEAGRQEDGVGAPVRRPSPGLEGGDGAVDRPAGFRLEEPGIGPVLAERLGHAPGT